METKNGVGGNEEGRNENKTETPEEEKILYIKSIGWKIIPSSKTHSLVKMYFEGTNKEKALALFLFKNEFTSVIENIFKKRMLPIMPTPIKMEKKILKEGEKCPELGEPSEQSVGSGQCSSEPEKPDLKS